jgi:pantoate--beta-alanine ligase
MEALRVAGFQPDYFRVCRSTDLDSPNLEDRELVVLAAAYLGQARLIDNLRVRR